MRKKTIFGCISTFLHSKHKYMKHTSKCTIYSIQHFIQIMKICFKEYYIINLYFIFCRVSKIKCIFFFLILIELHVSKK